MDGTHPFSEPGEKLVSAWSWIDGGPFSVGLSLCTRATGAVALNRGPAPHGWAVSTEGGCTVWNNRSFPEVWL